MKYLTNEIQRSANQHNHIIRWTIQISLDVNVAEHNIIIAKLTQPMLNYKKVLEKEYNNIPGMPIMK